VPEFLKQSLGESFHKDVIRRNNVSLGTVHICIAARFWSSHVKPSLSLVSRWNTSSEPNNGLSPSLSLLNGQYMIRRTRIVASPFRPDGGSSRRM